MDKLRISKKILFLFFIIGFFIYVYRGVLVSISNGSKHGITNIVLMHTNQIVNMENIKQYRAIDMRIRPRRETSIKLKYKIENVGCFRVDLDVYISNSMVGELDIIILDNGNIDYRDRMYLTFFNSFRFLTSWRHKIVKSEKIACRML